MPGALCQLRRSRLMSGPCNDDHYTSSALQPSEVQGHGVGRPGAGDTALASTVWRGAAPGAGGGNHRRSSIQL